MHPTTFFQRSSLEDLKEALDELLSGNVPPEYEQKDQPTRSANFRNEALRWCVRNNGVVNARWKALEGSHRTALDRDSYVLELWHRLSRGPASEWRNSIENHLGKEAVEIYCTQLFSWLLGRFNLPAALALRRGVPKPTWHEKVFAPCLGMAFVVAATVILGWSLAQTGILSSRTSLFGALAFIAVFGLGKLAAQLELRSFAQMLLPRLGATVGIGYLTLALAPDLVGMIYKAGTGLMYPYLLATALGVGCLIFTMLHVDRRVSAPKLWRRGLTVLALGIGHAATGLALFSPLLFHPSFLDLPSVHPCPGQLILTAAVALSLGVALQLVWEEKSLTEPL